MEMNIYRQSRIVAICVSNFYKNVLKGEPDATLDYTNLETVWNFIIEEENLLTFLNYFKGYDLEDDLSFGVIYSAELGMHQNISQLDNFLIASKVPNLILENKDFIYGCN